jgi:hypothetical protein
MRKALSEVIAVSNLHAEIDSPVEIPAMYTRTEVRELMFLAIVVSLFVGVVLGYGWHFAATENRSQTQIGRHG